MKTQKKQMIILFSGKIINYILTIRPKINSINKQRNKSTSNVGHRQQTIEGNKD